MSNIKQPTIMYILSVALEYVSKSVGIVVISIACVLITCVVYTHTHHVIPAIYEKGTGMYWASMGLMCWISTGVWINYIGALGSDPGSIPRDFFMDRNVNNPDNTVPNNWKVCNKCNCSKPERAHHCSLCGHCVAKMDHHCPWINNCVGYQNQRYFVSFLIYLLMGTLYCGLFVLYLFQHSDSYPYEITSSAVLLFHSIICVSLFFAMILFVGWNMYLVISNQTSVEVHINIVAARYASDRGMVYKNPYNLGSWNNFLQVFVTQSEFVDAEKICNRWKVKTNDHHVNAFRSSNVESQFTPSWNIYDNVLKYATILDWLSSPGALLLSQVVSCGSLVHKSRLVRECERIKGFALILTLLFPNVQSMPTADIGYRFPKWYDEKF